MADAAIVCREYEADELRASVYESGRLNIDKRMGEGASAWLPIATFAAGAWLLYELDGN